MGIGDEITVTGHVREMQLRDPRKVRLLYERPGHWSEVFERNPRIASRGEIGNFQEYRPRVNGLRPYIAEKTRERWTWRVYGPPVGELYFAPWEEAFAKLAAPEVIVEPTLKPKASPNKDWHWERWELLARLMRAAGLSVAQVGPAGTKTLTGVRLIETQTFRNAAAVLARAKAAVMTEGGLMHAAAAVGLRSVVIFGGYIAPEVTGYEMHTNIFTGQALGCGMRAPCLHCRRAMAEITPQMVMAELMKVMAR